MAFAPAPGLPSPVVPRPRPRPVNPLAGLLTNPLVAQADLGRQKTLADANALLRQQRSQLLIGLGDPGLARSLGAAVDPNTAAAAGANQYSTLANLGHQRDLAHRSLLSSLAARGMLRSGDLGYQEGELARNYGQQAYGATQQALSGLNDLLGGYLTTTRGANDAYTNALLQAFGQYGQNPLSLIG